MKNKSIVCMAMCAIMTASSFAALAAENELPLISPAPAAEEDVIVGVPQITVNGEAIDLSESGLSQYIFEDNGNVMVPLRYVAEKMGYTVSWDDEKRAVEVENDEWKVVAYIGEDMYYGVTKKEGAVGMTAPQSYGVKPQIIDNRTFVPARMFELMGYDCNSIGQFVNFTKPGTITDENGEEYSNNTLIISVDSNADKSEMKKFFEANRLEIVYEMDALNMYTVKLETPMSAAELEAFIARLEKNENITGVNKDYIVHLD